MKVKGKRTMIVNDACATIDHREGPHPIRFDLIGENEREREKGEGG